MPLYAALLLAQAVQCTAPAVLPAALAGWNTPGEAFGPGKAVTLKTASAREAGLPADSKPGNAVQIGFRVTRMGSYGIALDQPGWIDVLPGTSNGEPLEPVEHGHGADCSGIHKIVRFDLSPGVYRLRVSGLAKPEARVMLVEGK